jgi:hypothetical protein
MGGVRTVDEVMLIHLEVSGHEVILGGGIGLHDISSLTTNVQVVNLGTGCDTSGTGDNAEHEAAVLEGTASLRGVEGEGEVEPRVLHKKE